MMKAISELVRQLVINLRNLGKTYNEIRNITGVSKSSISSICRTSDLGGQLITELTEDLVQKAQTLYNKIGNIKKEADKCILVCANCHREIHAGVRKI